MHTSKAKANVAVSLVVVMLAGNGEIAAGACCIWDGAKSKTHAGHLATGVQSQFVAPVFSMSSGPRVAHSHLQPKFLSLWRGLDLYKCLFGSCLEEQQQ